jgi:hypothetical protein
MAAVWNFDVISDTRTYRAFVLQYTVHKN